MYDIIEAKYVKDYKVEFRFADNSSGIVDFSDYKTKPGLFSDFKDISFFRNFKLDAELSTITWQNGLDIAPDTLYFKATGKLPNGLDYFS
jgi:hypothetical protein